MEDLSHITANWARATAQTQLSIEAQKQLEDCLKSINAAVADNKFSTTVYLYAVPICKTELEKRGFKVESHSDQREGDWTTITW